MQTVKLPNGDTAEFPDDMAPGAMQAVIQKQFPPSRHAGLAAQLQQGDPSTPAGAMETLGGELVRGGKLMIGAEKPQGFGDYARMAAATIPVTMAAGAVAPMAVPAAAGATAARLAAPVARALTPGILAKVRGESNISAGVDVAAGAIGELGAKIVSQILAQGSKAADALKWIMAKVGKGEDGPINQQLVTSIIGRIKGAPDEAARGRATRAGLQEIKDKLGKDVYDAFSKDVLGATVHVPMIPLLRAHVPIGVSRTSQMLREGVQSPVTRATIDAALGTPPASALTLAGLASVVGEHGRRFTREYVEQER